MSNPLLPLIAKIRALRAEYGDETARAALAARTTELPPEKRALLAKLIFGGEQAETAAPRETVTATAQAAGATTGSVAVSGNGRSTGANVGVNQGTVQLFFGAQPPADGKALLNGYLRSLIDEHGYLRLGKLLDRERDGRNQPIMSEMALLKVYTTLITDQLWPAGSFSLPREEVQKKLVEANPDVVLPEQILLPGFVSSNDPNRAVPGISLGLGERGLKGAWEEAHRNLNDYRSSETPLFGQWYRPEGIIRLIMHTRDRPRLVLLGSPGSGKSTGLRHLAVFIATALLSGTKTLRIPFFCPLGPVAQLLDDDPAHDQDALMAALLRPVLGAGALRAKLRGQVEAAINAGNVFLFFDGLDEVSGVPEPSIAGMRSPRERIADAIRAFARQVGDASVVVTCRTRPYEQDETWQLREGWMIRWLQPFAFGQVRAFITRWYAATCIEGKGRYTHAEATERGERLIRLLKQPDRVALRNLAASPLLLTMLVLLDYNNTRMPERRADVYEELVKLLLDRWEGVRSSDVDRRPQRIGERLGVPRLTINELRPALHELAFAAHQQEVDGRGVLRGPLLRETLDAFFARKLNPTRPKDALADAAQPRAKLLRLLLEESGLLLEDTDELYVLPHLTFQEYLAACHLAGRDSEGIDLAYRMWAAGGERWREVAHLLMSRLLRQEKYDNLFAWLQRLVAPRLGLAVKPAAQRQRDALLAADCYAELGRREAFVNTSHDLVRFEEDLREALVDLVERPNPTLLLPQRLEAGATLGKLGDPRFPVADAEWRSELARLNRTFGQPSGYFCYVPGGRYQIGGWSKHQEDASEGIVDRLKGAVQGLGGHTAQLVLQPFWLARLPVTVAQYARFLDEKSNTRKPDSWGRTRYNGANQPVVMITRAEAATFCAWLSEQLTSVLPEGYVLRLPTEAEWEVGASWDGTEQRRPYPWGIEEPTPERAIYNEARLETQAPVGCCPTGVAACGALDMSGNVWELCASDYHAYPAGSHEVLKDFTNGYIPWRGGSYADNETNARCGARGWILVDVGRNLVGFRMVLAPRLAHKS